MDIYRLLRPLLFSLDAEMAHEITLAALNLTWFSGLTKLLVPSTDDRPVSVMGLNFKNPVGLAAGLDKNGDYIDALAALGFGFIEIGTVTPRPQPGNPKPRLFRLPEHQAIINRMGFNNKGIDHLVGKVEKAKYRGILAINIGKNADTPIENALDDYLVGLRKAYQTASYITINISSPNTANLRQLQHGDDSRRLVSALKEDQVKLHKQHGKYTPIVLKIAPDLSPEDIQHCANLLLEFEIDGVIATNTTLARDGVVGHPLAGQAGGLSGEPLQAKSTAVVKAALKDKIPIIGVGGIMSPADAQEKIDAGASLVQVYSGLTYQGPQLVKQIVEEVRFKVC
jgi:dihydroorotate dehydrogenase